jgi:hypothetical protein
MSLCLTCRAYRAGAGEKCKRLCTGHGKRTGKPCEKHALKGGTVCWTHGGAAGQVKRKAQEREALRKAREAANREANRLIARGEHVPIGDPFDALLGVAAEMVWIKDVLGRKVQALDELRYRTDSEQTRAELTVYTHLLDQCARVLTSINKLGLDDRRVRVQEAQVALLSATVAAALRAAGLDGAPLAAAQREVARRLRAHVGTSPLGELPPPGGPAR